MDAVEILKTDPFHCVTLPQIRRGWAAHISLAFFSIIHLSIVPGRFILPGKASASSPRFRPHLWLLCLLCLNLSHPTSPRHHSTLPGCWSWRAVWFSCESVWDPLPGHMSTLGDLGDLAASHTLCFITNSYLSPASLQTPAGPSQQLLW